MSRRPLPAFTRSARFLGLGLAATAVLALGGCAASDDVDSSEAEVNGPNGVEFIPMPVETESCNATVLRGTKRFAGRGYVLPQAYVGTNVDGRPLFEVIREGGGYKIRLGVYFHGGGDEDVPRALSNRKIKRSCGNDELRAIVNKGLDASERIGTFQPLPVNDIKVKLTDTVKNRELVGSIVAEGAAMLGYVDQDYVFEFNLPDRASYDGFVKRLRGSLGVPIVVNFLFTAQQSEALSVKVDFSSAEDALGAEFAGAPAAITRASFKAKLGRVLSQMRVEVVMDGVSDAFTTLAGRLVDQLVVENPALREATAPATGSAAGAETSTSGGDEAKIQVAVALQMLRTKKKFELKLENAGKPIPLTYAALTSIRADDPGADAQELRLYTNPLEKLSDFGGRTQDWGVWGRDLEPGRTLRIIPLYRRTYEQRYTYATHYFRRKNEITSGAHKQSMTLFPEIERSLDSLVEPSSAVEGARIYSARRWVSWLGVHYWGYQDIVAEDVTQGNITRFGEGAIRSLDFLRVTIDNSGRSYALSELDKVGGPWTVTLDEKTNTVQIVAKERIERLKLTNRESFDPNDAVDQATTTDAEKQIVRRRYFREARGPFGGFDGRTFVNVGAAQRPPRLRSEIAIKISSPDEVPPQAVVVTDSSRGVRSVPASR